jgi:hypothetical protein
MNAPPPVDDTDRAPVCPAGGPPRTLKPPAAVRHRSAQVLRDSPRAPPAWVAVMWKSVFLATGLFACIVGAELLFIDSASVKPVNGTGPSREMTAPDWAPWAMISAGAVTLLHFGTGVGSGGGQASHGPKPQPGKFPQF